MTSVEIDGGALLEVNMSRKRIANKAISDAKARLSHSDIVGTTTFGRLGFECVARASCSAATLLERLKMVQRNPVGQHMRGKKQDKRAQNF